MGEMAEYILNGDDCQFCGEYLGDGEGFPRSCQTCGDETKSSEPVSPLKKAKEILLTNVKPAPTESELARCAECAQAGVMAIEQKMEIIFGKGKRLSKGSKKRLRKSLAHSVLQAMQHQGVI